MILIESLSSLIGAFIGNELTPRATRYTGDIVDDEMASFDLDLVPVIQQRLQIGIMIYQPH